MRALLAKWLKLDERTSQLERELAEEKQRNRDLQQRALAGNQSYLSALMSKNGAQEELKQAVEELNAWKSRYADELQKRLALADRVKELEEGK